MERQSIKNYLDFERYRQDQLHPKFTSDENKRLAILVEEVGEVATAIQNKDQTNLKEELLQVMAVCCRWLESYKD